MTAALFRHGVRVDGVLDLLGTGEVAHTAALGWALKQSPKFADALTADLTGSMWSPTQITLERRDEEGRTDVELRGESRGQHIVIEAKLGTNLPTPTQLDKYTPRLVADGGVLVVVSHRPAITAAPVTTAGLPVTYRMWRDVIKIAESVADGLTGNQRERLPLKELLRYLRKGVIMPGPSARVWVVPVGHGPVIDKSAGLTAECSWLDVVDGHDLYFHPAASKDYPSPPQIPHYLGFRYAGALHRISHVDRWEVVTDLSVHLPAIPAGMFATTAPHVLYHLGPAISPSKRTPTGRELYAPGSHWADFDLLLVGPTVADAVAATRAREANAVA